MSVVKQPHKILVVDDEPDVEPLVRQRMRRDVPRRQVRVRVRPRRRGSPGVAGAAGRHRHGPVRHQHAEDGRADPAGADRQGGPPTCAASSSPRMGDMENIRTAMNRGGVRLSSPKPLDFADLRVTIDRTLRRVAEWREALASRDKLVVLQNELDLASKMQQSILPTRFPEGPDFRIHGQMEPGARRRGRLLRRHAAGERPHRPGDRRRPRTRGCRPRCS